MRKDLTTSLLDSCSGTEEHEEIQMTVRTSLRAGGWEDTCQVCPVVFSMGGTQEGYDKCMANCSAGRSVK